MIVPGRDDYWSLIEHVPDTNAVDLSWLSKYRLACLGKKLINGKTAHKGSWSFTINVDDMIYK